MVIGKESTTFPLNKRFLLIESDIYMQFMQQKANIGEPQLVTHKLLQHELEKFLLWFGFGFCLFC